MSEAVTASIDVTTFPPRVCSIFVRLSMEVLSAAESTPAEVCDAGGMRVASVSGMSSHVPSVSFQSWRETFRATLSASGTFETLSMYEMIPVERRYSLAVIVPAFSVVAAGITVVISASFHSLLSLSYECLFAEMVTEAASGVLEIESRAASIPSSFLNDVASMTPAAAAVAAGMVKVSGFCANSPVSSSREDWV